MFRPFFSEHQAIATDPTNLLIRSLTLKKKAAAAAARSARAAGAAKRAAGEPVAGAPAAKRQAADAGGSGSGTPAPTPATEAELKALSKAALVERCKAARVAVTGTKGALVARLLAAYGGGGG